MFGLSEVECPGGGFGGCGVGCCLATGDEQQVSDASAKVIGEGVGEGGQLSECESGVEVADGDDGAVVLCGIAAADAEDFVVVSDGDTVAGGVGPASGQFPWCAVHEQCGVCGSLSLSNAAGNGQRQRIDSIGPHFGAAIPWFLFGEVGAADDEQVIFGDSGEGAGEAFSIGQWWQFPEAEGGWWCGGGVG